jgi:large-conductance mechanosensitive channel
MILAREFKEFDMKRNVFDMAVGVGAAQPMGLTGYAHG